MPKKTYIRTDGREDRICQVRKGKCGGTGPKFQLEKLNSYPKGSEKTKRDKEICHARHYIY